MPPIRKLLKISLLLCALCATVSHAQPVDLSITISSSDSVIALRHPFIFEHTLRLTVDSSLTLDPARDFIFDKTTSTIRFSETLRLVLFSDRDQALRHHLRIEYQALPLDLKKAYTLYETEVIKPTDSTSVKVIVQRSTKPTNEFLSNFQRSGAITRGLQLGSGRDLSLTSGFNLQFTGDLAEEVTVTGALTEETIPIQPEGNTQTLRELDRIFINVKASTFFEATFGDFFLDVNAPQNIARLFEQPDPVSLNVPRRNIFRELTKTSFTSLSRKVLGVQAIGSLPYSSLMVGGASNKGKFHTNTFTGQELFQGPYRLTGQSGERASPVLAGTERVYVDGVLQTRGERNDYTIDYALAELTFQPRRLITSASRITIDFEYADQEYSRTLLAARAQSLILDKHAYFGVTFLREGDNPDAPLNLSLSDQDRSILTSAGGDRSRAVRSGVIFAGRDERGRGKGTYIKVDSAGTHYRYRPQDSLNALYNVSFGYRGSGLGAYQRRAIGEYAYVGIGRGDHDTLVTLPFPSMTEVIGLNTVLEPLSGIVLSGEVAGSRFSPNRFTDLRDEGLAYKWQAGYNDSVILFGQDFGDLEISYRNESVADDFRTLDRMNSVEFNRRYGLDEARTYDPVSSNAFRIGEGRFVYSPIARLQFEGFHSNFRIDTLGFRSTRTGGRIEFVQDSAYFPALMLFAEHVPTDDEKLEQHVDWKRYRATASKELRFSGARLTPFFNYSSESKRASLFAGSFVSGQSFQFREYNPGLKLDLPFGLAMSAELLRRTDDSIRAASFAPVSLAHTIKFAANLNRPSGFAGALSIAYREKLHVDSLAFVRNGGDQEGLLLRFEPRYSTVDRGFTVDALYDISNQRAARTERLFFPVQKGYGNYRYVGDLNNNRIPDAEEFTLARYSDEGDHILLTIPSEQLYPTTELRSQLRVRISPTEVFGLDSATGWAAAILRSISTETLLRLEETSTIGTERDIYLLNLAKFQNDSTTLHGRREIDQSIYLLENNPTHSYRLHFTERTAAQQYTTGLERTYRAERSIRGRFKLARELTNETTFRSITDIALTRSQSYTQPYNVGTYHIETEWGYHPSGTKFDYGLKLEASSGKERMSLEGTSATAIAVTGRTSYSLESRTRLRAELERDELTIKNAPASGYSLPYALTLGRTAGITWLWRLALDYNLGSGVIATITYDGRNQNVGFLEQIERQTIHNARAEVRAAF